MGQQLFRNSINNPVGLEIENIVYEQLSVSFKETSGCSQYVLNKLSEDGLSSSGGTYQKLNESVQNSRVTLEYELRNVFFYSLQVKSCEEPQSPVFTLRADSGLVIVIADISFEDIIEANKISLQLIGIVSGNNGCALAELTIPSNASDFLVVYDLPDSNSTKIVIQRLKIMNTSNPVFGMKYFTNTQNPEVSINNETITTRFYAISDSFRPLTILPLFP